MRRLLFLLIATFPSALIAHERVVNLVLEYKTVNFTGKSRQALSINNQIPSPTLHFKQGDHVRINVYNHLKTGSAIHWHGLLVPWQMDGVEGISQKAIPPGGVFHYEFTIRQSGTYWYHAHANTQEQDGLYGALIIDPPKAPPYHYNKDFVVVLSDWSNTKGMQIYRNLKKDGDYYSPRFPLQPSLMKFIHDYRKADAIERKKLIADYKMMQQMRMSIYDFSDVAYQAFLLNGHPNTHPWMGLVKRGDVVRLRFIGAAASSIFHVKIVGAKMELVHVEGNDVRPSAIQDFYIAPGETDDVLVKIQKNSPYLIYAESLDTSGAAVGALITKPHQAFSFSEIKPFPEPLPVTRSMMMGTHQGHHSMNMSMNNVMDKNMKMDHGMHKNMSMNHSMQKSMNMSSENSHLSLTSGTKYQNLVAAVKTNDPNIPITKTIKMELFGYMGRYIWFLNGVPEYKAKPIIMNPGKRYRIIFTNSSMMRHPMHIHGHWFILRNGHGAFDPLLHTIEVPPGAKVVADVDTDASGQWFFHCHHLYHMMAGMAQVLQYSTIIDVAKGTLAPENEISNGKFVNRPIIREDAVLPIDPQLIHHPMAHSSGFFFATNVELGEDPFNNVQMETFKGLYGWDYNKLELFSNDGEMQNGLVENADLDIFYWHLISQFWAIKGGANYVYRPGRPYWEPGIGIEGLMPYFIDTDFRAYYYRNFLKFDLELSRDTQITNNFFIRLGIRGIFATNTNIPVQIGSGLNQLQFIARPFYRLAPGVDVFTEYELQQDYGALSRIKRNLGEPTRENTLTFGLDFLF